MNVLGSVRFSGTVQIYKIVSTSSVFIRFIMRSEGKSALIATVFAKGEFIALSVWKGTVSHSSMVSFAPMHSVLQLVYSTVRLYKGHGA